MISIKVKKCVVQTIEDVFYCGAQKPQYYHLHTCDSKSNCKQPTNTGNKIIALFEQKDE